MHISWNFANYLLFHRHTLKKVVFPQHFDGFILEKFFQIAIVWWLTEGFLHDICLRKMVLRCGNAMRFQVVKFRFFCLFIWIRKSMINQLEKNKFVYFICVFINSVNIQPYPKFSDSFSSCFALPEMMSSFKECRFACTFVCKLIFIMKTKQPQHHLIKCLNSSR